MAYSDDYKKRVSGSLEVMIKLLAQGTEMEKLDKEVGRLISASKLEGHDEIAILSRNIKNVTEALQVGKLLPTDAINSVLKEAVDHIRDHLEGRTSVLDSSLTAKLKDLMKYAKSDERDFIFTRRIRVLYIDEDEFAHINIKKVADHSVEIASSYSATEAKSLLDKEKFDAILCEMNLPDYEALDLFGELSNKFPVVAISQSDDPRQIQVATRAGAMDYIIKNDAGILWIPRSLHTATNEWNRRKRTLKKNSVLEDPDVKRLVLHMLQTGSPLTKRLTARSGLDFAGDESDRDYTRELQMLEAAEYVRKEHTSVNPSCPKCNSAHLVTGYSCSTCNGSDFTKGGVLEHNKCGYTDFDSAFAQSGKEDKLTCPKCNKELKLIGVDYFRIDSAFKCKKCKNVFASPRQRYACVQCGHSGFDLSECGWVPFYTYWLDAGRMAEIRNSVGALEPLKMHLDSKGYQIQFGHKVDTKFGTFGPFDLVAYRNGQPIIVSMILGSDIEDNHTKIIELDTLGSSVDFQQQRFAIMFAEPREVTRNLLAKFKLDLIVAENETALVRKFSELVKS